MHFSWGVSSYVRVPSGVTFLSSFSLGFFALGFSLRVFADELTVMYQLNDHVSISQWVTMQNGFWTSSFF